MAGTADDTIEIRAFFERWYGALENGDVAELLSLVTPDVIVKPPGAPPIMGIGALREALTAFLDEHSETVDFVVDEIEVSGSLAFARISECANILPKSEPEGFSVDGMHLAILRRQPDGGWLLTRDVSSLIDHARND
ncbi:MAG: SgcJ/EcaC family oxidoreductase [Woeseiaceae bacterium]|nr:SgcJ/EcaC family oxidoreductase [Woeseiaceae bacterium]